MITFDLILGTNKFKKTQEFGGINVRDQDQKITTSQMNMRKKMNFDFEFRTEQIRRKDEYDDIGIYFLAKPKYLISENRNQNNQQIEEIKYGVIDPYNLSNFEIFWSKVFHFN